MTAAVGRLSGEDVEALRDWWDGEREGDSAGSMLGRLDATVADIIASHVTAALNETAAAIDLLVAQERPTGVDAGLEYAARIVRAAANP